MSRRQMRHFAWTKLILTPVVHAHPDTAGDMVLQVTSLATFGITIGFKHVDHFHPGCKVARPNVTPPNVTSSSWPLSNERFSSGSDKVFFSIFAMTPILD